MMGVMVVWSILQSWYDDRWGLNGYHQRLYLNKTYLKIMVPEHGDGSPWQKENVGTKGKLFQAAFTKSVFFYSDYDSAGVIFILFLKHGKRTGMNTKKGRIEWEGRWRKIRREKGLCLKTGLAVVNRVSYRVCLQSLIIVFCTCCIETQCTVQKVKKYKKERKKHWCG